MKNIIFVFIVLLIFPLFLCYAGNNNLSVDVVSYKNLVDDKGNFTELYYSIPYEKLEFHESENTLTAMFEISFTVKNLAGEEMLSRESKQGIQTAITDKKNRAQLQITDILKFYIKPGEYAFEFEIVGDGVASDLFYEGEFIAPDYSNSEIQLSQIEICSNITTDNKVEKYIKNNLMVYPNPSRVFNLKQAVVFFYAELYNLEFNEQDSLLQEYSLSYHIINSRGDTVKSYPKKRNKKAGKTSVIANILNLRKYETGDYTLILNARDEATLKSTQQTAIFSLESIPYITEIYAKLFREMVTYIATQTELDIYDQLNLIGKQTFIENYWQGKDPTPGTIENEYKLMYFQRWEYVNVRYANEAPGLEGWESDRGRIYLKHGPPTDVERNVSDTDLKPHEIWLYEGDRYGTKMFIFTDARMQGRYILVHSKSPDQEEVYNPNWRDQIRVLR